MPISIVIQQNSIIASTKMEFNSLPVEIKLHIFSFLERQRLAAISPIQAVNKEFRDLAWRSRTHFTLGYEDYLMDPLIMLSRYDANTITNLDLSGADQEYQNKVPSAIDVIIKYSALEELRVENLPTNPEDLALLKQAVDRHKSLIEIQTGLSLTVPIELYQNIAKKIRLFVSVHDRSDIPNIPTFNFYNDEVALFLPTELTLLPTNSKAVKGITIDNKIIVGTTDGTILVHEYNHREERLELSQTLHEHTKDITCFHYTPHFTDLVIGSMDGKVTRWNTTMTALLDTKQFPEPIHHVYYSSRAFDLSILFAASKHKVWFYVGDKLKKHGFVTEHVITGLHYDTMRQDLFIATEVDINRIPGHAIRYSETFQVQTSPHGFSNFNVSESQIVASLTPTQITVKPFMFQKATTVFEGQFDASDASRIIIFQETFVICSNGPCLLVFDLESKRQVACISPRISKADLLEGKFPTCTWLWCDSLELYAIFSDNKLYSWTILSTQPFMPVSGPNSDFSNSDYSDGDGEQFQESLSDGDMI